MKKTVGMLALAVCMLLAPCAALAAKTEGAKTEEAATGISGGFLYRVEGNYAVITGYMGESAWAIIPETLDGYEVREIGDSAFEGDQHMPLVMLGLCG